MSLTRFYDDDARVKKQLEESLNVGLYHLDVPGNGLAPPFMEDRQIRLQKWGANLRTNTIDIDNDLKGLRTKLKNDKEFAKRGSIVGISGILGSVIGGNLAFNLPQELLNTSFALFLLLVSLNMLFKTSK